LNRRQYIFIQWYDDESYNCQLDGDNELRIMLNARLGIGFERKFDEVVASKANEVFCFPCHDHVFFVIAL
jgi:hypothetical protein